MEEVKEALEVVQEWEEVQQEAEEEEWVAEAWVLVENAYALSVEQERLTSRAFLVLNRNVQNVIPRWFELDGTRNHASSICKWKRRYR